MRQARSELRQVWDQWLLEPERLVDVGDAVIVVETARGRGRGSGIEISMRSASRYLARDGRIARVIIYLDVAEAFADVGLQE